MISHTRVCSLILMSLVGCGPEETQQEQPTCEYVKTVSESSTTGIRLQIGTGLQTYTALDEGDEVRIIAGPQGGYHVWFAIRLWNWPEDEANLRIAWTSADGKGIPDRETQTKVSFIDAPDLSYKEASGIFAYVDSPENIRDTLVQVQISVSNCQGQVVHSSISVIPR